MSSESSYSEVVKLTRELVQIRSENPSGSEREVGEHVYNWLFQQGVEVWKEPVEGDRFNVVARISGQQEDVPSLFWLAHMDTVPAGDGWTVDPFGGDIIDGLLYGRGSADMKGGLAAGMVAIRDLASQGSKPKGDLMLLATVDEEGADMKGAMAILEKGWIDKNSYLLAIEPSGLQLLAAHKGPVWYEIITKGKMSHAGMPEKGIDAIHAMSECLLRLKELIANLGHNDELLGRTTINIGKIEGGIKTNIVPVACRAEVDIRVATPLTITDVETILDQALKEGTAKVPGSSATSQRLGHKRPPQKMPMGSPLLEAFRVSVQEVIGKIEIAGLPAYTDAAIIASYVGTPHCLTFGPGYLEQAHGVDEFVPIEQLDLTVKILKKGALKLLW